MNSNSEEIPQWIYDDLFRHLSADFDYKKGNVLSSTCTSPHQLAIKLFQTFIDRNLGDPSLFPGAKEIEHRAIRVLGDLLHLPEQGTGFFLTGGSESNITALWAARNKFKKEKGHEALHDAEILAPASVHLSVDKAADLMGITLKKIPVDTNYRMDIKALEQEISEKTVAIVAVAGTTLLGSVDPIAEIGRLAQEHDIWLHVDAALGGLILPFYKAVGRQEILFDFKIDGVSSLTVDPHKFGRIPIPAGVLLYRDRSLLKNVEFYLPYLGEQARYQHTLTGTRTGASAIAFYGLWKHLGFQGYVHIVQAVLENTQFLAENFERLHFRLKLSPPPMNIIGVNAPPQYKVENIYKALWKNRWAVSLVNDVLRVVIMPVTKRKHLETFLSVLQTILRNQN